MFLTPDAASRPGSAGSTASNGNGTAVRPGPRRSTTLPPGDVREAVQADQLRARVTELELALATADSEMQEVVSRMNTEQSEVLQLQEERESAVRETRRLQRQLEAEADKAARIKQAEASAQARRIEAAGEAESRQKLADAEAYRLDRVGRVATEQMAREGALLSRHPLLIQKTVADKLSDKVQVIIAPPNTDGRFIASGLVGAMPDATAAAADTEGEVR